MKFKNLTELKNFLIENAKTAENIMTPEGLDKQFKNGLYNDHCLLYSYKEGNNYIVDRFYCDKSGNAITKEEFKTRTGTGN